MGFKKIIGIATVAATLAVTSQAQAFGGRTVEAKITKIFATASGDTLITLDSNKITTGQTCSVFARYSLPAAAANAKSGLATALTARALDTTVELDITTCDDVNGAASPVISNIILK